MIQEQESPHCIERLETPQFIAVLFFP